jgi:hypothetical protein
MCFVRFYDYTTLFRNLVISDIKTDLKELLKYDVKICKTEVSPAIELDSATSGEIEEGIDKWVTATEDSEDIGETDEEEEEEDEDSFVDDLKRLTSLASSEGDCSESE